MRRLERAFFRRRRVVTCSGPQMRITIEYKGSIEEVDDIIEI
jgi:hypothetical protein